MARKLINQLGYDPKNLQVLLGGWNLWVELHNENPNLYPTVPNPLPTELPAQPIQQALPPPTATQSK